MGERCSPTELVRHAVSAAVLKCSVCGHEVEPDSGSEPVGLFIHQPEEDLTIFCSALCLEVYLRGLSEEDQIEQSGNVIMGPWRGSGPRHDDE